MTNTEEIEKEAKLYGVEVGDVHALNGFIKGAQWMQSVLESRSDRLIKENKELKELLSKGVDIIQFRVNGELMSDESDLRTYEDVVINLLAEQALKKP